MQPEVEARKGLTEFIVSYVEQQPHQVVNAGSAHAVMSAMRADGHTDVLDDFTSRLGGKTESSNKHRRILVINECLEFIGGKARVKRPMPKPEPVDRISELLVQHA